MHFQSKGFFLIIFFSVLLTCNNSQTKSHNNTYKTFEIRFSKLLEFPLDSTTIPRGIDKDFKKLKTSDAATWTSGFFAGNLWYIYKLTKEEKYKAKAQQWTKIVEGEKYNNEDHDIGFKIYNSFGNAYKITKNEAYADVIVTAAKTLISRYNPQVKAIQSWNAKEGTWDYHVIIDNMMNLELLFEATLISKDSIFHNIAVNHANTTLKNHFRPNHSTYHVIDYNLDGSVKAKKTHQGFSDLSIWSRGQAWAVYGYTMAYRYTKNKTYLNQAEKTALFYLSHSGLPKDGIPFWDFNDPNIPNAPKDVSAATVMASAFIELYTYTKNKRYLNYANKVLKNLKQKEYLINSKITAPFILTRSTGNYNKNSEIDCPIVYADYYLLETLVRKRDLKF